MLLGFLWPLLWPFISVSAIATIKILINSWVPSLNALINRRLQNVIEYAVNFVVFNLDHFRPVTKFVLQKILFIHGIKVNGNNKWDIQVYNDKFYAMVIAKGLTGFAESIVEGYIGCEDLEDTLYRICSTKSNIILIFNYYHPYLMAKSLIHKFFDIQTEKESYSVIGTKFDNSHKIFELMCDSSLVYSTMHFENDQSLNTKDDTQLVQTMDKAVDEMRENVARKLKLEPGMTVLDLSCGYGGFAKYLAEKYNVKVTGVTISEEMEKYSNEVCKGLDVTILRMDYRKVRGKFDRIVSLEMLEYLGEYYQKDFFKNVNKWLVDDGIFVLNTVSVNGAHLTAYDPIVDSLAMCYECYSRVENIVNYCKNIFVIEEWQNLGLQYGLTSKAKMMRLINNRSYFEENGIMKQFFRLSTVFAWLSATGRTRNACLYSIVFSKK